MAPGPAGAAGSEPPLVPEPPAAVPPAIQGGFWARAWDVLVKLERGWRVALYYFFLVLVCAAGVAAIGLFIGAAAGAFPVTIDDTTFTGPARIPMALVGAIVGFVGVSIALAIVTLVLYGLGFLLFALAIFVVCVVLIALSPVLAPLALLALGIWWLARRRKAAKPPPPRRIEPTLAE